jgi:hypothetical protein
MILAAPNPARGGPVRFLVDLTSPARVRVTVFSLSGETIWGGAFNGKTGDNELLWQAVNRAGEAVSPGLYVVRVEIQRGGLRAVQSLRTVLL